MMKLIELNWNPSERQLKQFGLTALVALPALTWLWGGTNPTAIYLATAVGALLAGLGLLLPRSLKPIFIGLSLLLMPIGIVVGELAMLLMYFAVFVPMGIVFRLMGRDSLERKFDRQRRTYWRRRRQPSGPASYFRQW